MTCPDCGRSGMRSCGRGLCSACYRIRWHRGAWDGPLPDVPRRIWRVSDPGPCRDCQRQVPKLTRGLCANCYRIRRYHGNRDWYGPMPPARRPSHYPAGGGGRRPRPRIIPSQQTGEPGPVDWSAMTDVIRVLR